MSLLSSLKHALPERHPLRLLWHKSKAFVAALRYGFPARHLKIVGITGTDGKTTTVGMVAHILSREGKKVGALSTAFFQIGEQITWNATQKTSPSPFVVQRFLRKLINEGCTHAVLEYSSHGLVQGRTLFAWPLVAGITNTSAEHLDYHGTMEQYRTDKGLLFRMLRNNGTKVLNADDGSFAIYNIIPSFATIPYSPKSQLKNIQVDPRGCTATATIDGNEYVLKLSIPGAFNLENALCAISCCQGLNMHASQAIKALESFRGIPGRMERIEEGQNFSVFVDFTVTPASYERTLSTLKAMLKGDQRLLVLTGSCGDRMREKRPEVGRIVSNYADIMVVANEDPYTEDPQKIIDEVWAGVDQSNTQAHQIFDRREAIQFLLSQAKEGDIVILCGKGSDTTMYTKEGQVPWNEREITRALLGSTSHSL